MAAVPFRASKLVEDSCAELGYNLSDLVALSSVWANPKVMELLAPLDGVWYPNRRRANEGLRVDGKRVEKVGDVVDGITLDNNTYANNAFKLANGIDRKQFIGFHVCHIWPRTVYDHRYYSNIANLVAIPSELASLTDHHFHVAACLKYRSWELYGWKPHKELAPVRPADYPVRWRDPFPFGKIAHKSVMRKLGRTAFLDDGDAVQSGKKSDESEIESVSPVTDEPFEKMLQRSGFENVIREGRRFCTADKHGQSFQFAFRVSSFSKNRNDWSFTFDDIGDDFSRTTHLVGLMRSGQSGKVQEEVFIISPVQIQHEFQNRKTWYEKKNCNRYDVKIPNGPSHQWQRWITSLSVL